MGGTSLEVLKNIYKTKKSRTEGRGFRSNFFDKPIIHYPLKVALKSNIFNKIHVSTDSKRIQKTVQIIGNFVDFLRSIQSIRLQTVI